MIQNPSFIRWHERQLFGSFAWLVSCLMCGFLFFAVIEFVDQDSGLVYMAPSYPDEEGRETGIAAQMLLHARQLEAEGSEIRLHYWMDNLNIMRRLTWLLGFGSDLTLTYN